MSDLSKRLLKDLQWLASHKGNSYTVTATEARQILEALDEPWFPVVEKQTNKDLALRSLKRGLEERFGRRNVRVDRSLEQRDGREYDYVAITVSHSAGWPDEVLEALAKASGFSRHFEQSGSGSGRGGRDVTFIARRGRKAA